MIDYTDDEHRVWQVVAARAARQAPAPGARSEVVSAGEQLGLPDDHIPQLTEVNALLAPHTGFRYQPAAGLVPLAEFYGSLADGRVLVDAVHPARVAAAVHTRARRRPRGRSGTPPRWPARGWPRSTGRPAGRRDAARRRRRWSSSARSSGSRWSSACCARTGDPKAYGAGLLSSYGEIEEFVNADLGRLDIPLMGTVTYDITHYQPVLFCGESLEHVEDVVGGFFESADDALVERLTALVPAP